jgi:hypothetical protein
MSKTDGGVLGRASLSKTFDHDSESKFLVFGSTLRCIDAAFVQGYTRACLHFFQCNPPRKSFKYIKKRLISHKETIMDRVQRRGCIGSANDAGRGDFSSKNETS